VEIRAHAGALLAAGLAGEQRLYVGQPDVIRPSVRAYRRRVITPIIGAVFSKKMRTIASALGKFARAALSPFVRFLAKVIGGSKPFTMS
jgi:hypothetical protein